MTNVVTTVASEFSNGLLFALLSLLLSAKTLADR